MLFRRSLTPLAVVGAILVALTSAPLQAQLGPGPGGRAPYANQPHPKNEAGRFDYYALVLSWSPTYCAGLQRGRYDPQCHRRDGKRYAFVLHGLWPQYERGWPQDCPTRTRPFVPQSVIDEMLDIMPSPRLVIHEYRKHGTCSGLAPDAYFKVSRQFYSKLKIPPRYDQPNRPLTVSPAELVRDFLEVNPDLKPESLAVSCGGSGNRLREIRVCVSREGAFRPCGQNENARRLCSADKIYLPPVRGTGRPTEPSVRREERRI